MEMQDRLLQDFLLLLVGPSRGGRTRTGRIPQQSSPGGRKGSLGWKNTSPSILARPGWRGSRRRGGRRWARSSSPAGQWLTVTCRLSQKEYIVRQGVVHLFRLWLWLSMTWLDLRLPKMTLKRQKTSPFSTCEVIILIVDHVKHYLGFTIMDYAPWANLSREKLLFFWNNENLSPGMSNIEELIDNLRKMVSNPHEGLDVEVHGLVNVLINALVFWKHIYAGWVQGRYRDRDFFLQNFEHVWKRVFLNRVNFLFQPFLHIKECRYFANWNEIKRSKASRDVSLKYLTHKSPTLQRIFAFYIPM